MPAGCLSLDLLLDEKNFIQSVIVFLVAKQIIDQFGDTWLNEKEFWFNFALKNLKLSCQKS